MPSISITANTIKYLNWSSSGQIFVQKKFICDTTYYNTDYTKRTGYCWFKRSDLNNIKSALTSSVNIDRIYISMPVNASSVGSVIGVDLGITPLSNAEVSNPLRKIDAISASLPAHGKAKQIDLTETILNDLLTQYTGLIFDPRYSTLMQVGPYQTQDFPVLTVDYSNKISAITPSASTVAMGGSFSVSLSVSRSEYTHKITCVFGSRRITQNLAAGVTSCTLQIPVEWCTQVPNAVSGVGTVTAETFEGSTSLGTSSARITFTVPVSVVPSPGSISYTVDNPLNIPISNRGIVASLSGQAGVYGSTISAYVLQSEGFSSSSENLVIDSITRIPSSSQVRTITISATVTDSRGRSATTTRNVDVYEWDVPYFSALEYYRCNSAGVKSEDGHYIRVQGTYACFSANNRNSISPCTIKIVPKRGGTEIDGGQLAQNTPKVVGGGSLSSDDEYYLRLTLTDRVTSIVYQYNIFSSVYVIHFRNGGTGVAFGMAAVDNNTVKINPNWALIIGNDIDVAAKLANLESRIAALE